MITWYAIALIAIALASAVLCLVWALRKRGPDDWTMGATLLVGVLLLVQIVIGIVQPLVGNPSRGDPLEFWMYLIVAAILPFGAGFWALMDRTRWANLVLAVVHFSAAVMTYRMLVIWG
ncbi:hypothetical protein JD292_09965 [Leucobacter sp. CSA2]|uniref:Uncharacterized protein n=1 Tax=Leucobacter edaphi TaxID=2796472 RepID=A0A934QF78_9MICO|nr:hypothetical protein [Leucobacter edaphi]MBK0422397.1 hypothetical protein [Leucobacter edaphi]